MNSSLFFEFLSKLPNLEKTRNFATLGQYDIRPLLGFWDKIAEELVGIRISVVGTNGKGSVSHFLSESLRTLFPWSKVGLYTSPHLLSPTERIRWNQQEITTEELDSHWLGFQNKAIQEGLKDQLSGFSYFELFTLLCAFIFQQKKADFQIWEAGLGGRLDATKLTKAEIVVVTKIGMDHAEILGYSPGAILKEKLGICTENTKILFTFPQSTPDLNLQMETFCTHSQIEYHCFPHAQTKDLDYLCYNYQFVVWMLSTLEKKAGVFPSHNSSSLKPIAKTLPPSPPPVPGRLETLQTSPLTLFDPAHNPQAVEQVLQSLSHLYPDTQWRVYFFCQKDKDKTRMLQILQSTSVTEEVHVLEESDLPHLRNLIANASPNPTLVLGSFRIYPFLKSP